MRMLLIIAVALMNCAVTYANVTMDAGLDQHPVTRRPVITISGQITPADLSWFLRFARLILDDGRRYYVFVDSPGGDLNAAIAIGRAIRKDEGVVIVSNFTVAKDAFGEPKGDARCSSSCVFILAGGVERDVSTSAKVEIHRPYDPGDTLTTTDEQKRRYEEVEKLVKTYLREMNVSTELWDQMMRIPPGESKRLTDEELRKYGLNGKDPYWDAAMTARRAKSFGISLEEYLRRQAVLRDKCSSVDEKGQWKRKPLGITERFACMNRVEFGVRPECESAISENMPEEEFLRAMRKEIECSKKIDEERKK